MASARTASLLNPQSIRAWPTPSLIPVPRRPRRLGRRFGVAVVACRRDRCPVEKRKRKRGERGKEKKKQRQDNCV